METPAMSHSQTHAESENTSDFSPYEAILERFKQELEQGKRPAISDFWPAEGVDRVSLLAELVRIDLAQRLKAGESARAEDYLQKYPVLGASHRAALARVVAEYELRRLRESGLATEDYVPRSPEDPAVQLTDSLLPLTVDEAPIPQSSQIIGPSGTLSEKRKPAEAADPPWPRVEGYEIVGELGRGGMGVVYKARH